MTDKEKEAIKEIEYARSFGTSGILPRWSAIETVLNLLESYRLQIIGMKQEIQTQQKEIERIKNMYDHLSRDSKKAVDYTFELNAEIDKKDKIIDELIDALMSHDEHFNYCDKKSHKKHDGNCKSCLKEYFINKVEKENKKWDKD